jgi:hypothetical protein
MNTFECKCGRVFKYGNRRTQESRTNEAAAQAAFEDIAAIRDRIQAALEVIEQVKECCSEPKVKQSYNAKSVAIARILTWL